MAWSLQGREVYRHKGRLLRTGHIQKRKNKGKAQKLFVAEESERERTARVFVFETWN